MLAKIDICYSIVFYGLGSEGLLILRNNFRKKYKEKFIDDILRFLSLKPANDNKVLKKWMVVSNRNTRGKRNKLVEDIYNWRKTKNIEDNNEFSEIRIFSRDEKKQDDMRHKYNNDKIII